MKRAASQASVFKGRGARRGVVQSGELPETGELIRPGRLGMRENISGADGEGPHASASHKFNYGWSIMELSEWELKNYSPPYPECLVGNY